MNTQDNENPVSELILYRTEDAQTRIQVRLDGQSVWLTQRQIADLFEVTVPTVNEHLSAIYAEGELEPERTLRKFRIVQTEGQREVRRREGKERLIGAASAIGRWIGQNNHP